MMMVGTPDQWVDLIDSMVPNILDLVTSAWEAMPPLSGDAHEDPTTKTLCRLLRQHRNSGELPFRIDIQMVELDPAAGQDQGRLDITFSPMVPRENIYFALECKRLNVVGVGGVRSYAGEYVIHGMRRFIHGQYAAVVRHGGMLAYVLDRQPNSAIENVSKAIRGRHVDLGMSPPGTMLASSIRHADPRCRETRHIRSHNSSTFAIHHVFVVPVELN
jgi:hypothetical protein